MGFLDKRSRIVDVALTARGRQLYSLGRLEFVYFAAFDDGVDYDPWPTGSLTEGNLTESIEHIPLLEAPVIPLQGPSNVLPLEPTSNVFTAADGFSTVPRVLGPTGSYAVTCVQYQGDDSLYERKATTFARIPVSLQGDVVGADGFAVKVFVSGSNGLRELHPKRDTAQRRALDPFVAVLADDEASVDAPRPIDPRSVRR